VRRSLLTLFCLVGLPLFSQCSDAGVCVLGHGLSPAQNQLRLTGQWGRSGSPDDLNFQALKLDGRFPLGDRATLIAVVPIGRVSGPLGSTTGLGDAILALEATLHQGSLGRVIAQAGARLATGEDDAEGLPQRYQSGLGSTDPIVGVRLEADSWEAGLGYQRASSRSRNRLQPLKRGDDLLVHVGFRSRLGSYPVSLQALAIQRLGKSDIRLPDGSLQVLPDTDRLQVNLVGGLSIPLSRAWAIEGRVALPLLKRPDNTDGLKRALSLEWGVSYPF